MSVSEAFNKMIDRPCMATSFAYSMIRVSTFSCERGAISTARTDKERATILSSSVHRTFFPSAKWALLQIFWQA